MQDKNFETCTTAVEEKITSQQTIEGAAVSMQYENLGITVASTTTIKSMLFVQRLKGKMKTEEKEEIHKKNSDRSN